MDDLYRRRHGLDKHSSIADVEQVCGPEICRDYSVFATVRHPLHRLCSLYNFLGHQVQRYAHQQGISVSELAEQTLLEETYKAVPELAWLASQAFVASANFSSFIRDERLLKDRAFHSQVSRLRSTADGGIPARVLRLEKRVDWLPRLKKALGLPLFTLPLVNQSEARLIAPVQVSPEDRAYIEQTFREDYLAFDYPPVL
jgi:hypothetical protein